MENITNEPQQVCVICSTAAAGERRKKSEKWQLLPCLVINNIVKAKLTRACNCYVRLLQFCSQQSIAEITVEEVLQLAVIP